MVQCVLDMGWPSARMVASMVRRLSWVKTNSATSEAAISARASSPRMSGGQRSVLKVEGSFRTKRTVGLPPSSTAWSVAGRAVPPV